jgi:hypothetical protein
VRVIYVKRELPAGAIVSAIESQQPRTRKLVPEHDCTKTCVHSPVVIVLQMESAPTVEESVTCSSMMRFCRMMDASGLQTAGYLIFDLDIENVLKCRVC